MSGYPNHSSGRGFAQAIDSCLQNYAGFAGRAPRSEYWYWTLFVFLLMLVCDFAFGFITLALHMRQAGSVITLVITLATFIPSLAVMVRRLHDIDRSGWWYFIALVPLVGPILLFVWFCTKGTTGRNRFGPDPLGGY